MQSAAFCKELSIGHTGRHCVWWCSSKRRTITPASCEYIGHKACQYTYQRKFAERTRPSPDNRVDMDREVSIKPQARSGLQRVPVALSQWPNKFRRQYSSGSSAGSHYNIDFDGEVFVFRCHRPALSCLWMVPYDHGLYGEPLLYEVGNRNAPLSHEEQYVLDCCSL